MEADPHAKFGAVGPAMLREMPLDIGCGGDRVGRVHEDREE